MNTTNITETNGVITRVTIIQHDQFNYRWLALGIIAFALLAWVLRKVFWNEDSN